MATIAQRAKKDIEVKLKHESKLSPRLKSIFRQMAKDFKIKYLSTNQPIDAKIYESEFSAVITQRSRLIINEFKYSYRQAQKKDEEEENIDNKIDAEMLAWITLFVSEQLRHIISTTNEQIQSMISKTIKDLMRENTPITKEIIAQKVSEKIIRTGMARAELISSEVVNTVAEKTKNIEVLVIVGVVAGAGIKKQWYTHIDGKERATHHNAHGQIVKINEPFLVGASLMMHPKDWSMGAESKEIFNCRCSAVYF